MTVAPMPATSSSTGPTSPPPVGPDVPPPRPTDAPPARGADGPPAPGTPTTLASLEDVLARELDHISRHRHPGRDSALVERQFVGLALSGGGIRSATTCLGILQALSKMGILPLVDYLSSVSGGGYIGSCLSSLLSLNSDAVPPAPRDVARLAAAHTLDPCAPACFANGEQPAFGTDWQNFPLRAERDNAGGRLGTDLVGHLRTHGNFLIARRGLLKRDALRAAGNLVTGIVFSITTVLLVLFATATLYLAAVVAVAPALPRHLGLPDTARVVPDTARRALLAGDSTIVRTLSQPCPSGGGTCATETRTGLVPPGFWQHVGRNARVLGHPFVVAWHDVRQGGFRWPPPAALLPPVLGLIGGAVLSMIAFFWIYRSHATYVKGVGGGAALPKTGESQEDAFERRVLRRLAWLALGVLSAAVVVLLWWGSRGDAPRSGVPGDEARFAVLFVPFAIMLGAWITGLIFAGVAPYFRAWTRRLRSLWGGYQAIALYGWVGMLGLAVAPIFVFALRDNRFRIGLGAAGALLLTRLLATRGTSGGKARFALPPGAKRVLLALAVLLVIVLGLLFFGALLVSWFTAARDFLIVGLAVAAVLFVVGWAIDQNKLGPHYFYRDRLAETYLLSEIPDTRRRLRVYRDAMEMPLHCLHGEPQSAGTDARADAWRNPAPYHLISAAINLAGSRDLTRKDRKSGYWLFSKLYCGSTHTGFRATRDYRHGETKLARAVAISGAAASSAIGFGTFFAQSFATVLFNVRLGYWMDNPRHERESTREERFVFWPKYLLKEAVGDTTEHDRLVNLSDGGHTGDNVGIYPLLQRRCKVILACDAERDPDLTFGSFTEVLRHAYIDLGVGVDIDLSLLRPDPATGLSRSHCAVGRINYPDRPSQESYLVYMKNSLTGDEPAPVLNYKSGCPAFPHETTVDQFFNDAQFESYRALGVHLAEHTFGQWVSTGMFQHVRGPLNA